MSAEGKAQVERTSCFIVFWDESAVYLYNYRNTIGDTMHEVSKAVMTIYHFIWILRDQAFPKHVHHINFGERDSSKPLWETPQLDEDDVLAMFLYFRSSQQKYRRSPAILPQTVQVGE